MLDQAADAALEALSELHHLDLALFQGLFLGAGLRVPKLLCLLHGNGEDLRGFPDLADLILAMTGLRQVVVP
jgi:hypothetical protein